MERVILHSDLNNFYASAECFLNPQLYGEAVAVCGDKEERHGIVLAKNQKAKLLGVTTGEPIWKAKAKCPALVIVPPHFEQYLLFSKRTKKIYEDYTDLIEPFGIDECWLDVTKSVRLFGGKEKIAEEIKKRVKKEVGLTVSIGVSFNKVFAKLGSDMKKPDAITIITREKFREKIWNLDADCMLGVGRATGDKLRQYGINTIGDIANTPMQFLKKHLGICGVSLWNYANGLDTDPVAHMDDRSAPKSVGHGVTCVSDLHSDSEVWRVIYALTLQISHKLRREKLLAGSVVVQIKNTRLKTKDRSALPETPTHNAYLIAKAAFKAYRSGFFETDTAVRAVTVRVTNLVPEEQAQQMSLFEDTKKAERRERAEQVFEKIRNTYGGEAITYASLMGDLKLPGMHKN